MSVFKDKYFIISVTAILIFTLFWTMEDEITDDDIKGVVFDIKETKNGFTFSIETSKGDHVKCFYRECPENMKLYSVKGTFSEDKTILFIEKMIILEYGFNQ